VLLIVLAHTFWLEKPPNRGADPRFRATQSRGTVCVTCAGAGVDSLWEQKKLEARKILENAVISNFI